MCRLSFWGVSHQRFPNRGGNWNNGTNAGVFNTNLNNARTNTNTNIGFRSALLPCRKEMGTAFVWKQVNALARSMALKGLASLPAFGWCGKKIELP